MRSVRYFLGSIVWGKDAVPRNLDDCLDHCNKSTPKKVSLELEVEEINTDIIFKQISANYIWTFEDKQAKYRTFYEMIFAGDMVNTQKAAIDLANEMLKEDLERIAKARIPVEGEEKRFDYSIIY